MAAASPYLRHRFPPEIIAHCVLLYLRFPLSLRAVEEMMLLRGVQVSYETIRRWRHMFGHQFANELRRRRPRPGDKGRLDEVFLKINGQTYDLWRAVDHEGTVLAVLVQSRPWRESSEAPDAQTDEEAAVCAEASGVRTRPPDRTSRPHTGRTLAADAHPKPHMHASTGVRYLVLPHMGSSDDGCVLTPDASLERACLSAYLTHPAAGAMRFKVARAKGQARPLQ